MKSITVIFLSPPNWNMGEIKQKFMYEMVCIIYVLSLIEHCVLSQGKYALCQKSVKNLVFGPYLVFWGVHWLPTTVLRRGKAQKTYFWFGWSRVISEDSVIHVIYFYLFQKSIKNLVFWSGNQDISKMKQGINVSGSLGCSAWSWVSL